MTSCAEVKVQVNLLANFPKYVETKIANSKTKKPRIKKVKIQYDFLQKYCKEFKLQSYNEVE